MDAEDEDAGSSSKAPVVRHAVVWLGGVVAIVQATVFTLPVAIASWKQEPWVQHLVTDHFPAIVGLPSAALASFLIIAAFEARFDKIKMKVGQLVEFSGASGPIVLWVLCFCAMAAGIKLVW
ncbi:hypothetical protein [Amycolatopsis sp. WQ 127309]|uniref:hypothetical protein n=1 Tax=Amycolatopsis sp. WQ 127309 TaxID=2932773 RepID=UPI001FF3EAF2|nr:hypothetical protein [Amycolatopsis sp. WQ 127309]UOZ07119.1 hypothetical protein MUY22_02140 [Amycolatopsis sp. WQ 127309]